MALGVAGSINKALYYQMLMPQYALVSPACPFFDIAPAFCLQTTGGPDSPHDRIRREGGTHVRGNDHEQGDEQPAV